MNIKTLFVAASTAALLGLATAANAGFWDAEPNSTDEAVAEQMERLLAEGERQTGLPGITSFTERRAVRYLYELRDQPEYQTYTYLFVPMTGTLVKLCDSIGYGINASIQYSNPEKTVDQGPRFEHGYMTMPQAEPNGLFMPEGLAATYVLCINTGPDAEAEPVKAVYIEPEIIVSPFELNFQ
jgi:hypothetical protein